ncbi:hypothetical protein [Sunxiuqinia elliptica]|uniref:Uncharacterized protein n=1 Tax=Sunxiuqinia elliptica TaxID=655355 RepID=A0A4R6H5F7_9BACT|nr:hypothetical protein [Sunxiuqinia elliptica]TDO02686.1 hypothetical protein DET52_104151 [Sunxiuqinia elliptica]TDO58576.1 hypothetical protein DET65_3101 [Sunxiuqinia elliptica]
MEKRFNIYSMGVLVLKDDTLIKLKKSLNKKGIQKKIDVLGQNEFFIYHDPETGRQWEYERVI